MVSVIIPCLNAGKYISESIKSVLHQKFDEFEIIVVDDGSNDDTKEIVLDLKEKFENKIVLLDNNGTGASAARNTGFNCSRGEYIQYLDADDVLLPDKLYKQAIYLDRNPNIGAVISARIIKNEKLSETIKTLRFPEIVDDPLNTCINKIVITNNPLIRREWVNEIGGYREDLPCSQDWDFHIRLAAEGIKFSYIDEILLVNRQVRESLSSDWKKVGIQNANLIKEYKRWLLNDNRLNNESKMKFATILYIAALITNNKKSIDSYLKESLIWSNDLSFITNKYKHFIARRFGLGTLVKVQRNLKIF